MAGFLVLHASKYGSTERIAERLEAGLGRSGRPVMRQRIDALPSGFVLEGFDAIVVASPVFYGDYPKPVKRFVARHAEALSRQASVFVSVCGAANSQAPKAKAEAAGYPAKLLERTGWRPREVHVVAGTIAYTKYDPITRFILKRIAASKGSDTDTRRDWEYTDWAQVDAIAAGLVRERGPRAVAVGR
jgi:menaquinone-dependent protoporphyrinogen oxidase